MNNMNIHGYVDLNCNIANFKWLMQKISFHRVHPNDGAEKWVLCVAVSETRGVQYLSSI